MINCRLKPNLARFLDVRYSENILDSGGQSFLQIKRCADFTLAAVLC